MRDRALREALTTLSAEAATRFSALVATGDEIPFDVAEDSGETTSFYRYVPLTARFVRAREDEIRSLPSFGPTCAAVSAAGVAAAYLEERGEGVPEDVDERAARMLVGFIAGLWDGSAEFSLDRVRLDRALAQLDAEAREVSDADQLIAPIVGLRMPVAHLHLPSGVRVVRADTVEAPIEAMRSEGMQRAPWEPQYLALAELGEGDERASEAIFQLHDLVSVMRLFKQGGVGLGPYAFAPTGEGHWRRIATGAPAARPGGYELSEEDCAELGRFARDLEARPDPEGALAWGVARFEMGCDRPTPLEGLSDHLLSLRAVLEGTGPVDAALPVRAAALVADLSDRDDASFRVERAFALERLLMSGRHLEEGGEDSATALELAGWIEGCARAILREGALGNLGDEVSAAADEALVATGLAAGDAESAPGEEIDDWSGEDGESEWAVAEVVDEGDTRVLEPVPVSEDEIRITATGDRRIAAGAGTASEETNETEDEAAPAEDEAAPEPDFGDWWEPEDVHPEEDDVINHEALDEESREATLEWPAATAESRPAERERIDNPRVRHLFPVPDDADWSVRELEYDRSRRERVS